MSDDYIDASDYESGTILFSGPDDELSIEQAKEYIKDKSIDKDMIKLIRYTISLENGNKVKIIAVIVK